MNTTLNRVGRHVWYESDRERLGPTSSNPSRWTCCFRKNIVGSSVYLIAILVLCHTNGMALMDSWLQNQGEKLVSSIKASKGENEIEEAVYGFLEVMESSSKKFTIPEFEPNLEWLNCPEPLSFSKQLNGKLCVLDFFTYCCINCMHILPDLEAVEEQFSIEDGVVILGVHSAKFENEKSSANILSAVLRYDIRHPVVNDSAAALWNLLSVQCWPTLVVVSPDGKILTSFVGEGHRDDLQIFLRFAVKFYKAKGS